MKFRIKKPRFLFRDEDSSKLGCEGKFTESEYMKLEKALGYAFSDRKWINRALTHRSSLGNSPVRMDYERLEFLGDAVWDLAVAHLLSDCHPDANEGILSKMRAALVNTTSLARLARKINVGEYIRLGRGEAASGGKERPSILADVMEALIGAVYRDGGYGAAFKCVERLLGDEIETVTPKDPKTELQEYLHSLGKEQPTYILESTEGPEHEPTFLSAVEIEGEIFGRGKGSTKKASQQKAAEEALSKLKELDDTK